MVPPQSKFAIIEEETFLYICTYIHICRYIHTFGLALININNAVFFLKSLLKPSSKESKEYDFELK